MKILSFATVVLALGLAGCSSTNDRGVIVSKPMDLFGASPAIGTPFSASKASSPQASLLVEE